MQRWATGIWTLLVGLVACRAEAATRAETCAPGQRYYGWPCSTCLKPYEEPQRLTTFTSLRDTSMARWMGRLNRTRPLRSLVLPGTHHSAINGTRSKPYLAPLANWDYGQFLSVADLLLMGVRALDFRISTGTNKQLPLLPVITEPTIVHNYIYIPLEDALKSVVQFLHNYPSETVLLELNAGSGGKRHWLTSFDYVANWAQVDTVLRKYRTVFWNGSHPLDESIERLSGKIVLCTDRRSAFATELSCSSSWMWTNNARPDLVIARSAIWLRGVTNKTLSGSDPSGRSLLGWSAICSAEEQMLNPLHCYRDPQAPLKLYRPASIRDLAEICNAHVLNFFILNADQFKRKVHFISVDFAHPSLVNKIIQLNY